MHSLHQAASDAKGQHEESIALYKEHNARLQDKVRLSSAEISKGNTIIAKLQSDCRELKSKLRLKAAVMLQQQEHAAQKHAELDSTEKVAAELRTQAAELRADKERAEIAVLQGYLPQRLSEDETRAAVEKAIADTGASSKADLGKVIKAVMAAHKGQVDGKQVQRLIAEMLS